MRPCPSTNLTWRLADCDTAVVAHEPDGARPRVAGGRALNNAACLDAARDQPGRQRQEVEHVPARHSNVPVHVTTPVQDRKCILEEPVYSVKGQGKICEPTRPNRTDQNFRVQVP